MPEVIREGEDEGAEESDKEELTGSDHGACSSPTTTFLADNRPPDHDRSKRVQQEVECSERRHKRRKIELMHKFRMSVARIKRLCRVRSSVNEVDLMMRDPDEELHKDGLGLPLSRCGQNAHRRCGDRGHPRIEECHRRIKSDADNGTERTRQRIRHTARR